MSKLYSISPKPGGLMMRTYVEAGQMTRERIVTSGDEALAVSRAWMVEDDVPMGEAGDEP